MNQDIVWSADDEYYNFDSLAELIEENPEIEAGAVVCFGEKKEISFSELIDGSDIVEMISERAYDIAGGYADDFPDVSKEDIKELEALVFGWMHKHCVVNFWKVVNTKKHVITDDEIAEHGGNE
jgi:hypothetical protein